MKIGVFGKKGGEESANSKTISHMFLLLLTSKKPASITESKFTSG